MIFETLDLSWEDNLSSRDALNIVHHNTEWDKIGDPTSWEPKNRPTTLGELIPVWRLIRLVVLRDSLSKSACTSNGMARMNTGSI